MAFTILGLSGSLRKASINSAVLRVAAQIAPAPIQLRVYNGLGDLPLFNPDLQAESISSVERLRQEIMSADALLIASPEYAHGVTGVIKNALDWMVGNESFVHKPVALVNCSPRAFHAQAALREIVQTMSARLIEPAALTLDLLGAGMDEQAMAQSPEVVEPLTRALLRLQQSS